MCVCGEVGGEGLHSIHTDEVSICLLINANQTLKKYNNLACVFPPSFVHFAKGPFSDDLQHMIIIHTHDAAPQHRLVSYSEPKPVRTTEKLQISATLHSSTAISTVTVLAPLVRGPEMA